MFEIFFRSSHAGLQLNYYYDGHSQKHSIVRMNGTGIPLGCGWMANDAQMAFLQYVSETWCWYVTFNVSLVFICCHIFVNKQSFGTG